MDVTDWALRPRRGTSSQHWHGILALPSPAGNALVDCLLSTLSVFRPFVPMFGVINEAFTPVIGDYPMRSFYLKVHNMVREITGVGAGKGPMLSVHDGFTGPPDWAGLFPGADRMALDIHPYFAFGEQTNAALTDQGAYSYLVIVLTVLSASM